MLKPSLYSELLSSEPGARTLRAGASLFAQGEPAQEAFAVLDGAIEVLVDGKVVEVAAKGSLVGELALLEKRRRTTSARALTEARVVPLGRDRVLRLLCDTPYFPVTTQRLTAQKPTASALG